MTFSMALEALKCGQRIARDKWEKDRCIMLVSDITCKDLNDQPIYIGLKETGCYAIACIDNNGVQLGWRPLPADLLMDDWRIARRKDD